jgi:hypothetical protein
MKYTQLYSELGKLLYAIADIDRKVSPQEKNKLIDIIHNHLMPVVKKEDEFGTEVAYYPEFEFTYLESEIADAEEAFESFMNYVEKHHTAIKPDVRERCINVAKEMADAVYGINKKEQDLLDRLVSFFEELEKKEKIYPTT